jgi:transposase-like protein
MRKCTQYSAEFKEKLLAKAFSPNAPSVVELARRAGIPSATLHTWIHMKKKNKITRLDNINIPLRPKDITAEAKLQAVSDTLNATEEERSAYCRKHGFYIHHLDEWKQQLLADLKPIDTKNCKAEYRQLVAENKDLKRELTRKDKALAEASALLILKKKANLLWGDSEDD